MAEALGVCKKSSADRELAVVRYPDWVEIEVLASNYRLNGYSPPFDELPKCTLDRGGMNLRGTL